MKLQLIRHATLWLEYGGMSLLIDPMLGDAGNAPPIPDTPGPRRNPLAPLPASLPERLLTPDVLLVTHLHADHWDAAAAAALPRDVPLVCQPGDAAKLAAQGFVAVKPVASSLEFRGVTLTRTGGRHGRGELALRMGPVSGFVLQTPGEPTVYIAGDTVWGDDVRRTLEAFGPQLAVVNAGGARFLAGDPITMDAADIVSVCRSAPRTRVAAVHLDAINHCVETRAQLTAALAEAGVSEQVIIVEDGGWIQDDGQWDEPSDGKSGGKS